MRVALLSIVSLLALSAAAQPASVSRVLRNIDFEERRLGNDEDLPMHWVKVEAAGFPHYVNGSLTTDRAHGGTHSFRFDLNGGSLLYRYESGQIPVQMGATYHVEGWAQTTVMNRARARITGYFTDADGHPLAGTVVHSEAYAAKVANEPWKKLSLDLTCRTETAAYLVLELGLLQPEFYQGETLGQRTLFEQDIHGSAWFDDVTVSQVPQVALFTPRPGNVFRASDPLVAMMDVDDAFLVDLSTQLFVRDGLGRVVYQRSDGIEVNETKEALGVRKRMSVPLPALDPGWYRVTLLTSSQGHTLASREVDVIRLADDGARGSAAPDERFGLIATDVPFESWDQLPELVSQLGCGRVKLGVWSKRADPERLDPAAFDGMIARFADLHITPTACLLELPPNLIAKLRGTVPVEFQSPKFEQPGLSWLRLLAAKDEDWQPNLEYLLARYAAHLDRWQLGADGSDAFAAEPKMRDVYAKVYARFATLMREPDLAMPWPAWYELSGQLPATVAMSVPSSVVPSQLPLYMQDIKGAQGHHLSLSLQLIDRSRYGRDAQVTDMAERVIYALSAGADRIDLPCPFSVGANAAVQQPQELFVAMRTLLTTLRQATYKGKVPIADGVECFLFERNGQGILALWDTGRTGGVKPLAINLGSSPRMFDLWGNEIPLVRPKDDAATGTVNLAVSTMPTFLTNIDGALAQLRATVAIDRPLIESTYEAHTRQFKFTNTYPTAISGTLHLAAPKGWTLTPATVNFTLNPGETFDRTVSIEFPFNSPAGPRTIQAEFAIQATGKPVSFQMPLTVKLGLSQVSLQTMAIRDGRDVIVQMVIQNYGDKPIDYTAFALAPGQQRQERLITGLAPGRSIVRKVRFDGGKLPPGAKVRVGLKEMDGPRVLNDDVVVN